MKRISGNADDIKDKKDRVKKDGYNRGQHCIYCLTYHMIFVTHYRKPVINEEMSSAMKEFSNHMAEQFRGKILSAETDRDHIHLLVSLPPNTNVSVFVRSIKTQLSREMRKRFPEQIKQYIYGDDTSFWSRSYFIATTGSVSLETVRTSGQNRFQIPEEKSVGMMSGLYTIGAFIPRTFLRTAGVFCAETL